VRALFRKNTYEIRNATFAQCSQKIKLLPDQAVVVNAETTCADIDLSKFWNNLAIPRLADGGAIYKIFNDTICSKYDLSHCPYGFSLSDFAIETLSEKRFCEKFIIN
jgi:hypothetical protein